MEESVSNIHLKNKPPVQSVKKYYFLDYIFILLDSINKHSKISDIFISFLELKRRFRLGESKYKKLTADTEDITEGRIRRYYYTFNQVLEEAIAYELVSYKDKDNITLTPKGVKLVIQYRKEGSLAFNESLLSFMENQYGAFEYLIKKLYSVNKKMPGLLYLPAYSPSQLGFERQEIKTTSDFINYTMVLVDKLESDIQEYLGENCDLKQENKALLLRLTKAGLLSENSHEGFEPQKYNVITKRIRDAWITYFLRKVYQYNYSMHSFDIWIYRGKQIGILHATELHPYFHGKIVYPLSVIMKNVNSEDFTEVYKYSNGNSIFKHNPNWTDNQERFVDSIVMAYFELRKTYRSYFVNLISLREIVCLNMKISETTFEDFINRTYSLNLAGELSIKISLEVDKLPQETTAMYLKREPVMIDNKYRNIIAIDATKGGRL